LITFLAAVIAGLALLVWSADRFVDGAAAVAHHAGMSPLLIGMVIIGFGTSAPEMVVSAFAAMDGNPGLALGNAFGSNISNIGLIIGLVAIISPIRVHSQVIRKELPLLLLVTLVSGLLLFDLEIDRLDGWLLLLLFALLMGWSIWQGIKNPGDEPASEPPALGLRPALIWLLIGIVLLAISSRMLVWGAVGIASTLGVSDLIIGLTIVAIGTSLPELASSLAAIRKGEHDLALGNVIGSNLFNTLAVVGIATTIEPLTIEPVVIVRDWLLMVGMTVALLAIGYRPGGRQAIINRLEGSALLAVYLAYNAWLVSLVINAHGATAGL
jgi:cation:H+ antiporter